MSLTFVNIQTDVSSHLGLDNTLVNNTNIERWINITQQDIAGRWLWNWLYARESVATSIDETAGTVSVNSGSATVTGVSTAFDTTDDVNKYIQFEGANDWYRISAVASTTSLTIETNYVESANLSGKTYVIRELFYSLSATADRILSIRNWSSSIKVIEIDYAKMDILRPHPDSTGASSSFVAFGYDSSDNITFSLWPFPDDLRILEVRTLKRLADLTADGDTSSIPGKWHHVLSAGALALGFMYLRKTDMAQLWNSKYESMIEQMKAQNKSSQDQIFVLEPMDGQRRLNFVRFPEDFPEMETSVF